MATFLNSTISLVVTFTTLGLGYSSLYLGYFLANRLDNFKNDVQGTDKVMQSFVIGTVMLLYSIFSAGMTSFQQPQITKIYALLPDYFFVWIASTFFIMVVLLIHDNSNS